MGDVPHLLPVCGVQSLVQIPGRPRFVSFVTRLATFVATAEPHVVKTAGALATQLKNVW